MKCFNCKHYDKSLEFCNKYGVNTSKIGALINDDNCIFFEEKEVAKLKETINELIEKMEFIEQKMDRLNECFILLCETLKTNGA